MMLYINFAYAVRSSKIVILLVEDQQNVAAQAMD